MLVDGDANDIKKAKQPKVSIVVPCYNVSEVLPTAMESLLNQTLKDIEIICIDDASQDKTLIQLEKFASLDNRVQIMRHANNMSLFQSRMDGINAAHGEFIMFLDPDDWFKLDACERAYHNAIMMNADVLQFGTYIVPVGDVELQSYEYISNYLNQSPAQMNKPYVPEAIFDSPLFTTTVWNKIYVTDLLKKQFNDAEWSVYLNLGEDLFFWSLLAARVEKIANISEKLVYYRYGDGMTTKSSYTQAEVERIVLDCKTFFESVDSKINQSLTPNMPEFCLKQKVQVFRKVIDSYNAYVKHSSKTGILEIQSFIKKFFGSKVTFRKDSGLELNIEQYAPKVEKLSHFKLETKPQITCVMPVYNNSSTLRKSVSSILAQSFDNFELIIVDDSSNDGSLDIELELAHNDPRISVLKQSHGGAGKARNEGLKQAHGKYVTFLDGDDWFKPLFFEKLYASIIENRSDVALCRFENFENNLIYEDELYFQVSKFPKTESFTWRDFSNSFLYSVPFAPWTKLYNLSFLKKNHLQFQELYRVDDVYFWGASSVLARKMSFVDEVLVRYRVSDSKRNGDVHDGNLTAFFDAFEQLSVFYHNQHLWDEVYISFVNALVTSLMYGYRCLGSEEAKRNYIQLLNTRGRRVFQLDQIKLTDIDRDYVDIFIDLQDLLV
jgi:glycosyltransferase involved in cell wall biosynthesis